MDAVRSDRHAYDYDRNTWHASHDSMMQQTSLQEGKGMRA